jgi:hypothetical protein
MNIDRSSVDAMIQSLEYAVKVCYEVDNRSDDLDKSYPFATGYARATMQDIMQTLKQSILEDSVNSVPLPGTPVAPFCYNRKVS